MKTDPETRTLFVVAKSQQGAMSLAFGGESDFVFKYQRQAERFAKTWKKGLHVYPVALTIDVGEPVGDGGAK